MKRDPICTVAGCQTEHYCQGLCRQHYRRLQKYGDPTGTTPFWGAPQAFVRQVLAMETDECIQWLHARNKKTGHGAVRWEGKTVLAHRVICTLAHGHPPVPGKTYEVAHSCGNGHLGCVNPRHLRWATHKENMEDMLAHGTAARGPQKKSTKLTVEDVLRIRELHGTMTHRSLAEKFGVSDMTVIRIAQRKFWAWV